MFTQLLEDSIDLLKTQKLQNHQNYIVYKKWLIDNGAIISPDVPSSFILDQFPRRFWKLALHWYCSITKYRVQSSNPYLYYSIDIDCM